MRKQIVRIEIPSRLSDYVFEFWIGEGLHLVPSRWDAIPVTDEEHIAVVASLQTEARGFAEGPK